ncbi:hypothetical protein CROQUDRAFT_699702 [Cronartium quercuum f. sp. fusiforme G11]|uniref:Uncharacterized protein n=1 Tax=Cronartium quercuum f. sp. fusiforme G11 TaxID=708437 RepID=A0A9P6NN64_9BASI|nr:hypothetical protein CROQUDRAFT_699702 [Cronartium quercuum f. sp. fusiforme G11]
MISSNKTNTSKLRTTNLIMGQHLPTVLSNKELNEFKKVSMVIGTPPGFLALDMLLVLEITTKINDVLRSINAQTKSLPIEVASIAQLPSKDIKLYMNTRPMAHWLLNNKHKWTDLFCSKLKTYPTRFPVILHAVPTSFDPTSPSHLQE